MMAAEKKNKQQKFINGQYVHVKGSKYRNRKVEVGGIKFDSVKEANRYSQLVYLQNYGEITDLQMQVKYVLIPAKKEPDTIGPRGGIHKGKVIERECAYYADFVYKDKEGVIHVEDTKGFKTKEYRIKKKLMLSVYGITIEEI